MSVTREKRGTMTARLDDEGRIVLTPELRRQLALEPGDVVEVELGQDAILLRPCPGADDEDPAIFWGPNWQEELEEAFADSAAGRFTRHKSEEEFLASLEARINADI